MPNVAQVYDPHIRRMMHVVFAIQMNRIARIYDPHVN